MIEIVIATSPDEKANLIKEYMKTLGSPIDGYWENVVIGYSQCFIVKYEGKKAGHFLVDSPKTLVQFHTLPEYAHQASEILEYMIAKDIVEQAAVSTKEPDFLSLCLDHQKSISVDCCLFTDKAKVESKLDNYEDVCFRLADTKDIEAVKMKCDPAFEGYYEDLIENNQLFVLYSGEILLGIGEFRVMKSYEQYGDIGVIVVENQRKKGVGAYIITELKQHCYNNNLKPMACCNAKNIASRNTLEKSGFVSEHRIINVAFKS